MRLLKWSRIWLQVLTLLMAALVIASSAFAQGAPVKVSAPPAPVEAKMAPVNPIQMYFSLGVEGFR